jgi:dTDP-4-dehydrorhamnose reductase
MSFILNQDIAKCLVHLLEQPYQPVINLSYNYYITQAEFAQLIAHKQALPVISIPLQPFERAIKEAFTSSICLGTELADCSLILAHPSPEEKLTRFFGEI